MKNIDLGRTISIVANLGVIAGIVFLGLELRQNNELIEAEARFNRLSAQTGSNTLVAENADLARIIAKANNGEDLSDAERLQLYNYNVRVLSNMEWTYREVPKTEVPVELWRRLHWDNLQRRDFWENQKTTFSEDFIEFYENAVE